MTGPRWKHLSSSGKIFRTRPIWVNSISKVGLAVPMALGLACAMALGGCGANKQKLASHISAQQIPIASVEASLPKGPIAPGKKSPLVVKLTQPDGTVLTTEGTGRGKVKWKDLEVTAEVVQIDDKGVLSLDKDPRVSNGNKGKVRVTVPNHPGLQTELDVPFRYDLKYAANFSGRDGMSGLDGRSGIDGTSGTMGSLDPNHPSAGGDGSNGSNGTDGDRGKDGDNAPNVDVYVAMYPGTPVLLEASVSAGGNPTFYLIDPHGGSLYVHADGGDGGRGGKGGRGGRGGSGGIGTPNGRSGSDGLSGQDGLRGSDGRGGTITVTYDPDVKRYLEAIQVSSRNGPKPVYRERGVGPLW